VKRLSLIYWLHEDAVILEGNEGFGCSADSGEGVMIGFVSVVEDADSNRLQMP
jgi:hypothetical protein